MYLFIIGAQRYVEFNSALIYFVNEKFIETLYKLGK
jgi:hypothetical protein